jgi:hypothetical protein
LSIEWKREPSLKHRVNVININEFHLKCTHTYFFRRKNNNNFFSVFSGGKFISKSNYFPFQNAFNVTTLWHGSNYWWSNNRIKLPVTHAKFFFSNKWKVINRMRGDKTQILWLWSKINTQVPQSHLDVWFFYCYFFSISRIKNIVHVK